MLNTDYKKNNVTSDHRRIHVSAVNRGPNKNFCLLTMTIVLTGGLSSSFTFYLEWKEQLSRTQTHCRVHTVIDRHAHAHWHGNAHCIHTYRLLAVTTVRHSEL